MASVLTCYYRPKPGGFCARLVRAMQALLDRGHTLHYLAVRPFPITHKRCIFHRFPWPGGRTDTWLFWAVFHLLAPLILLGLAMRFRITHAFGFSPTYAFLLKPTKMIKSVELTCFLRGDALHAHRLKKRPRWIIRLDACIEGLAIHHSRLVGLQPSLLRTVLSRHPRARPAKTAILPNDLPTAAARARKARLPLQLGMVGILEAVKNQAWAIDLVARLAKEDFHLHFFGDGPDRERLKALVKVKGLTSWVTFWGWTAPSGIWPRLDLLLMPSLLEGMPNAVLEAIARHVPVLASDIAAHREILPQAQCLPLNNPGLWRSTLEAVALNPAGMVTAMAAAQRQHAQALVFDWEARVAGLIVPSPQAKAEHPA